MTFQAEPHSDLLPGWRNSLADYPWPSHFMPQRSSHKIHYIDQGEGEPMIMVHGNPTWSFYYRHLIAHFSQSQRAVALDHMGCGLSDKPDRYPYCLEQHIANLVDLVDRLDLTGITLLVHDWGGAIGLGAALRDLKRYKRFVLFNTGAFPPPFVPWRILACKIPLFGRVAVQGLNLFARSATWMATEQPAGLPAPVRQGMIAPYDSWRNRQAIFRFVADIPVRPSHPTWKRLEEIEAGLDQLKSFPIKLVWGMQDWCFRPECLRRFQQIWPHAETCEIAGAGHYVVEDATDQVIREVECFVNQDVAA